MPSTPPPGDPVPSDGRLPEPALAGLGRRPFGVYVHVPYCATRCGYCDFNTYTAEELGPDASRASYAASAVAEVRLARRVLGDVDLPVSTVFVGGGTPTLLPPADLVAVLDAVRAEFGLAPGAEVTTEANPDSVSPRSLAALREGGFTRVSFGMQSASPAVLSVLERTHTPGRATVAVAEARDAGFEQVSLDLIYGTPGETDTDWAESVGAAVAAGVDHMSAYALIVEPGTRLARRVERGELPAPDDDVLADRYLAADAQLAAAGLRWYEVSNWSRPGAECRHNLGYWRGDDWWGIGPGAHSHVGGVRWWNVRHPAEYGRALAAGRSPGEGREVLGAAERRTERVLLELRLRDGLPLEALDGAGRAAVDRAVSVGLLEVAALAEGRAVLTLRGRLLADAVVRDLLG
ncbi:MAG: radical SAM family heme chaperone HemW [Candidatus Nanopelagicales bacterium]